jgi:metallo-beta-lactamase class B
MKKLILAAALLVCAPFANAQTGSPRWRQPAEPMRLIGEIYNVGTVGLSIWLIKTPAGDILIDSGLPTTPPQIEANLAKIGVKPTDIKILLNSHAHYDHAGGFVQLKKDTGAKLYASAPDKPLLEGGYFPGRKKDGAFGFPAVKVDCTLADGQRVTLGGVTLTAHITSGHTPGCTTWTMPATEAGKTYEVMFFCSATPGDNKFVGPETSYPGIVAAYRRTFREARKIKADVFLAPHPEQIPDFEAKRDKLLANRAAGSAENPFVDPGALGVAMDRYQIQFEKRLAEQTKALGQKP